METNSTSPKRLSLEHPDYVAALKKKWRSLPLGMTVIEYLGDGDPAFGGAADDRSLGKDGLVLERFHKVADEASFTTIEDAHQAALQIRNRRPGSILGVAPYWR